jgi:folate-binding protein YgfZ
METSDKGTPMAQPEQPHSILQVTGRDRVGFLQNLVTNDISAPGLHYTALLTPQGKYLADFFVLHRPDDLLIDVASEICPSIVMRLNMYRLRADAQISQTDMDLCCGLGPIPPDGFADPRDPNLGWRAYGRQEAGAINWPGLRVAHIIPETGIELTPERFILEMDFERLNGVDFKKGCYVGQEIVARMKHKTELRKGLRQVKISGSAPIGTAILANEKPAGTLYTQHDGLALAYLRFDRIAPEMVAGSAVITV